MPQKPVFARAPLIKCPHAFLSNGMIRTRDSRVGLLYRKCSEYIESPCVWEGLFRLACLITKDPLKEPVADRIIRAIQDNEDGSFQGSVSSQIYIARAAFSVYQYNTDRKILKRLAAWLRYVEINFDQLSEQDGLLFRPADLMEFLVCYYQVTGLRSVLRLCTLLRASSFDWTTALHTFQQSVSRNDSEAGDFSFQDFSSPAAIGYDDRQKLINHAEFLADGVRYTLYSGLFSGNGQELKAGFTIWQYLQKHHRALCGGTTADPFLCGEAPDKPVFHSALTAWTEAFASHMLMHEYAWAADEIIRIIFNGLDDCLNHDFLSDRQLINQINPSNDTGNDPEYILGRLTRAVSCAFHHAVTVAPDGFRINYLLPCKMILSINQQTLVLHMDEQTVTFENEQAFAAGIDLFVSRTETADISAVIDHRNHMLTRPADCTGSGYFLHTDQPVHSGDGFHFVQHNRFLTEDTHHHGVCFFVRNRLMSLPISDSFHSVAFSGSSVCEDGDLLIELHPVEQWKKDGQGDIPVLPPGTQGEEYQVRLEPYSTVYKRITMFPRGAEHA